MSSVPSESLNSQNWRQELRKDEFLPPLFEGVDFLRNRTHSCSQSELSSDSSRTMPRQENMLAITLKLLISGLSGAIFGVALEKGRVFEPQVIRDQMLFSRFIMLKMFLSATATSMLMFSLMQMLPQSRRRLNSAIQNFIVFIKNKTVGSVLVGGLILGGGMTLSGACPGMVLAQVGASVPHSLLTMAGGICGAFLYALTWPVVDAIFKPQRAYRTFTLHEGMRTPYMNLALPMMAILGTVVFALELIVPWRSEVEQSGSGFLTIKAWPPYMAGIIIGLLQVPIVLTVRDTLGSATSYMTVAGQFLFGSFMRRPFGHLSQYRTGLGNWWQVVYVGGAVLGAHFSAKASGTLGSVSGVSPTHSFLGGIAMIYGSRLAGGCTSGHGLSGMGLLMLMSLIAVPAMFGGGIGTAVLMKYGLHMDV